MRIARWIVGAALALVLLVVAALAVATRLVNPDRYKGEIESAAARVTGRPLVLEGHLELSWFPWLGVRTGAARLESAPGAGGPDLIDWRAAEFRVRLLPLLLHRRVELARIRLWGLDIHLRIDAHGRGNWDDLTRRFRPGTGSSASAGAPGSASLALPSIAGLDLRDGALQFLDERTGTRLSLSAWRLQASALRFGHPVSVSTSFTLRGGTLPPAGIPVALAARGLTFRHAPIALAAPRLSLQLAAARLRGSARLRQQAGELDAAGSLALSVPSVREFLRTLGIRASLPEDPRTLGQLSLAGEFRYRDGALAIKPLTATIDATRLAGWVDRSGGAHPVLRFKLRANDVDFTRYLLPSSHPSKTFELPVKKLEALHAAGTLELERAQLGGTTMQNVRLEVQ